MINKVVQFIDTHIENFSKAFAKEVKKSKYLMRYKGFEEEEVVSRAKSLFKTMTTWLKEEMEYKDVGKYFVKVGKQRYEEGFPLCEVIHALFLIKNIFWKKINEEGFLSSTLQIYIAIETLKKIYDFFDVGAFYIVRGYQEAMYNELGSTGKITEEDLKKVFFPGSFKNDELMEKMSYKNIPFFDWKW
ncbi:conserved hypothetical protein [Thermotomaculum hydrothermale]|uniref:Histidine kinase N-terminal domain-containing protein n=1 Tax=Thermotomaculum hydrothermale TaxID=981385 RepID=A0A7R6SXY9_9BACT|nr:histidine kinase N-terminal domain-containing protein [Thermotomaculum hydrothermale]BBB32219.1 conserved hypothetical protein [Thermotomaculum hydrothermale]